MQDLFASFEATLRSQFDASTVIGHAGDRGENREEFLRAFLERHLPKRYGVTKGQVLTSTGLQSHAIDIIIYDALASPVLYAGQTAVLPIEGVYGIIEVKSKLSKPELVDAMTKIRHFKELAPTDLGVVTTDEYVTVRRPPRPFGVVFAYDTSSNSLESLAANYGAVHKEIYNVNFFTNLVAVLGSGVLHYERIDMAAGEKRLLLDTDEFVDLVLLAEKRERTGEPVPEVFLRIVADAAGDRTFGRFFVYLLIMLSRMKLVVPDLGRYLDPNLPIQIVHD